ncbi:hypothetical protein RRSWK_04405 [Rhodopirellula sp. SWK7]|nr:hypothetical protein RRSWK_04405 [Rhodopirellula sp. SWK7]
MVSQLHDFPGSVCKPFVHVFSSLNQKLQIWFRTLNAVGGSRPASTFLNAVKLANLSRHCQHQRKPHTKTLGYDWPVVILVV